MSFKELSPSNWTDADPVSTQFWRSSPLVDRPIDMDGQSWARVFLAEELKPHVPDDIRSLFAVARGALLYGWFFYPMFRLGEEQLYRVADAAAVARYQQLGGPKQQPTFFESIEWLVGAGVIAEADRHRWDATRQLRNTASHPHHQTVLPPGMVLETLKGTAHDVNRLFARHARRDVTEFGSAGS